VSIKHVDWESGAAPFWIMALMLLTIGVVMFVYILMNGVVTDFIAMGIANGADPELGAFFQQYWGVLFIFFGVIALIIEAVIGVQRT
jgi:uncharacterized membrane protein YhaH (DUF805 family)